jgi:hypothetical protein
VLRSAGGLTVGRTRFTAYATPNHSPGSTSRIWPSCKTGQTAREPLAQRLAKEQSRQ